jgi:ribonuclease P protein component
VKAGPREPEQLQERTVLTDAVDESFPQKFRLRRRAEIKEVQELGQKYVSRSLIMMVSPSQLGYRRLGITVSKKVGNAVVRARVKRLFREIFRRRRVLLPPSCDVVIIARASASKKGYCELLDEFESAAQQARRQ